MSAVAGANCGQHPGVAAVEICTRCGTFLCGECVEYFNEVTPACPSCLPLLARGPASTGSRRFLPDGIRRGAEGDAIGQPRRFRRLRADDR